MLVRYLRLLLFRGQQQDVLVPLELSATAGERASRRSFAGWEEVPTLAAAAAAAARGGHNATPGALRQGVPPADVSQVLQHCLLEALLRPLAQVPAMGQKVPDATQLAATAAASALAHTVCAALVGAGLDDLRRACATAYADEVWGVRATVLADDAALTQPNVEFAQWCLHTAVL